MIMAGYDNKNTVLMGLLYQISLKSAADGKVVTRPRRHVH